VGDVDDVMMQLLEVSLYSSLYPLNTGDVLSSMAWVSVLLFEAVLISGSESLLRTPLITRQTMENEAEQGGAAKTHKSTSSGGSIGVGAITNTSQWVN
jgi:hypothetical protein